MSNSNESIKRLKKIKDSIALVKKDRSNKIIEIELDYFKRNRKESTPEIKENLFSKFYFKYSSKLLHILSQINLESVENFISDLLQARENNKQIFIFGNGGSAATASHFANDFSKPRFNDDKNLFKVICLNDCISTITANANDYGYDSIFVNPLRNLLQEGDIVIAISSSGNSTNVVKAIEYANTKNSSTYAIVGFTGGELIKTAKKNIYIPTKVGQYGYMEDISLVLNHIVSIYIYEKDKLEHE